MLSNHTKGIGEAIANTFNSTVASTLNTTRWLFSQVKLNTNSSASFTPTKCPLQKENETPLPPMAMQLNEFEMQERNDIRCFHQVFTVIKDFKRFFYKKNPENSSMSDLEAYCRGSISVIAKGHIPKSAIPVYNDYSEAVGLCSEAINKFSSLITRPFTAEDFQINILNNQAISIPMLIKLEKWARKHKINLDELLKESKEELDKSYVLGLQPDDVLAHWEKNLTTLTIKNTDWLNNDEAEPDNPEEIRALIKKIAQDLINFRYVMGFAIVFVSRYAHAEDDMHRGNIGCGEFEEAVRDIVGIDFDMLKWEILYCHKKSGVIDDYTRDPSSSGFVFRAPTGRFVITANDITRLPHTKDACAFYRPTADIPTIPEWAKWLVSRSCSLLGLDIDINEYVSRNAYRKEDQQVFRQLTTHPVFIYFKYKVLLHYILTDGKLYEEIARLYVREDLQHSDKNLQTDKNLIEVLRDYEASRIAKFKTELYKTSYTLEICYENLPVSKDIQPYHAYLYVDADARICYLAKNSQDTLETLIIPNEELGSRYHAIKAILEDKSHPTLSEQDSALLAKIMAQQGYALKNTLYDFNQFLRDHGNTVKKQILTDFVDLNQEYQKNLVDINKVDTECDKLIRFADEDCIISHSGTYELSKALSISAPDIETHGFFNYSAQERNADIYARLQRTIRQNPGWITEEHAYISFDNVLTAKRFQADLKKIGLIPPHDNERKMSAGSADKSSSEKRYTVQMLKSEYLEIMVKDSPLYSVSY